MIKNTVYQHNGLQELMNYNEKDDIKMNADLQNVDVISVIGLIQSHTLLQFNESHNLNDMNWGVENGYISGGNCYMNIHTISKAKNLN